MSEITIDKETEQTIQRKVSIVITEIEELKQFAELCSHCTCCIEVHKGRWCLDGCSLLGLLSLDMSQGVCVQFDSNGVTDDFTLFVEAHSVK